MHSSLFNYRNIPVIIGASGGATFLQIIACFTTTVQSKFWRTVELTMEITTYRFLLTISTPQQHKNTYRKPEEQR